MLASVVYSFATMAITRSISWATLSDSRMVAVQLVLGLVLGGLLGAQCRAGVLRRVLLRLARRTTDADVWIYTFARSKPAWVRVQFPSANLLYDGKLVAYSLDPDGARELLLEEYRLWPFRDPGDEPLERGHSVYLRCASPDIQVHFYPEENS